MNEERAVTEITEPLVIEEVGALMRYATENGMDRKIADVPPEDPPRTLLTDLNDALVAYEAAPEEDRPKKRNSLLRLYTQLVQQTAPVHGRSLLDTAQAKKILGKISLLTGLLLVLALSEIVLGHWLAEVVTPVEGWRWNLQVVQRDFLAVVGPFIWGSLGACVYLLKMLNDIAQDRCLDRQKLRGWYLRVVLGGVLGYVVVQLFDLRELGGGETELDANAVAFLVGLGVKIVYGAIEKLIQTVADKLNLAAVRRAQTEGAALRRFLNQQLAEATEAGETERVEHYTAVIQDVSRTESGRS